jgi:hypothetical protein
MTINMIIYRYAILLPLVVSSLCLAGSGSNKQDQPASGRDVIGIDQGGLDTESIEELISELHSGNLFVSIEAARGLARHRDDAQSAIPHLLDVIDDGENWILVMHSAFALAQIDRKYQNYASDMIYQIMKGNEMSSDAFITCSNESIECMFAVGYLFSLDFDCDKVIELIDEIFSCANASTTSVYIELIVRNFAKARNNKLPRSVLEEMSRCDNDIIQKEAISALDTIGRTCRADQEPRD